ncbi:MAG: hypothetical protein UV83_C0001G0277 [candidate division WWE3 bacterium GW2011_GWE2_43_18]|nr:hypothetical protein P147_WWE3C00001G0315 [candidate division WWE3 bacterium RAAC2_WWE3_1]KKS29664.1 MAG: hypothetical protein UU91_C0004G0056 [candidate division WWE3 bacterium GW2011_GWB1_42_117]KKS55474.1 MAG: hypothetical protein UV21_C0001G0056 [candidate division WWE3 bacterium GW2011_GWD2_42_34]KKT05959.1 MAG: hypothetical protein UV83_C0001G0277 [candidate division WWE3 bacterium GW2011_GWE2_43_18]KKT06877.1 MAG: hypothetical protein UV84_C0003G0013 [candidate division WWE3 bacterium
MIRYSNQILCHVIILLISRFLEVFEKFLEFCRGLSEENPAFVRHNNIIPENNFVYIQIDLHTVIIYMQKITGYSTNPTTPSVRSYQYYLITKLRGAKYLLVYRHNPYRVPPIHRKETGNEIQAQARKSSTFWRQVFEKSCDGKQTQLFKYKHRNRHLSTRRRPRLSFKVSSFYSQVEYD